MSKREKAKSLFENIIKQSKDNQRNDERKKAKPILGIGHVIINSGGNTINIYGGKGIT